MKQNSAKTRPSFLSALLMGGVLAGALHLSGPALAQTLPGNDDLRALRYYVQHNETTAVEAEIYRLRAEFPSWAPPENLKDLLLIEPTSELAEIYARLGRGDIDGAQRVMERTKTRYPTWRAPATLTRQIELAEGQLSFDRAVNARDTATAVRIGSQVPALFRCDRINNAWNLAELQASAGSTSRALAAYSQIVRTCTSVPELVATIEKAEPVASDAQLGGLIETASGRFPAHKATFDSLQRRLMAGRGRGSAPAPAPKVAATTTPRVTPQKTVAQPTVVPTAEPAVQYSSNAPVASYGTQALSSLPRSGDGRLGQTRAAKESGNFRQCMANSTRPRSLDVAYERAWCAYNLDRSLESLAYFSAAARAGMGGSVPRDSRFGMTLSLLKRGMTDDAAQIAASTDLTLEQRKEVETIILDQRGVYAYQVGDYQASVDYLNALEQLEGGLRRDLAMMRGYAWMEMGEREKAHEQFQTLHSILATPETRKALTSSGG